MTKTWPDLASSLPAWMVIGTVVAVANVAYVMRNYPPDSEGPPLMLITAALIMPALIALSATLIRAYRIEGRSWSMVAGGLTGVAMPVLLFWALWIAAPFAPVTLHPSWHRFIDLMVWTMLASSASLLVIGLASGISIGYASAGRWEKAD